MATKKTPLQNARMALSGAGLKNRVDAAEARALGGKPKADKMKTTSRAATLKPAAKHVAARQAKIEAAAAADRKAIAAKNARKKK